MKCPVCEKEGVTSLVYPGACSTTLMYCQPYYDEDGKYHDHDFNTRTISYNCFRGHRWSEKSWGNCWCGWSGGDSEIEILPDREAPVIYDVDLGGDVAKYCIWADNSKYKGEGQ